MKTNQSKRKLQLKKEVVANLAQGEQKNVVGGLEQEAAAFTSIFRCSKGGLTCGQMCTNGCDVIVVISTP